ncbi:hypothetical protein [Shewanella sp. YQ_9]|uniref:hypothetical protein n=1 Tax=Shewanella sp. YQ_9 TaxID=3367231 RepID=UPI00370A8AD5
MLKQLRSLSNKLVHTKFQHQWQWLLEFSGPGVKPPTDFDIYAKSIEHGGATIEADEKQIGSNTVTSPSHKTAGEITLTIRDNEDARCENFFKELVSRVVNEDGTVNLPAEYLFKMRMYRLLDNDEKVLYRDWLVWATGYGGFVRSRDERGTFVSFQVTFRKHSAF